MDEKNVRKNLYDIWYGMKRRCLDPRSNRYYTYGQRGITICQRWMDFNSFLEDMEASYKIGLTIDRIDTNGAYELANCHWATNFEQQQSRTNNIFIEYMGIRDTIPNWGRFFGIPWKSLHRRIRREKWDLTRALHTPIRIGAYSHG